MKKLLLSAALMLGTTTLATAAEPDASIFAANGCDDATLVPVMSDLSPGEVLYWTNTDGGGCPASKRGGFRDDVANGLVVAPVEPEEPGEEEPTDPKA